MWSFNYRLIIWGFISPPLSEIIVTPPVITVLFSLRISVAAIAFNLKDSEWDRGGKPVK